MVGLFKPAVAGLAGGLGAEDKFILVELTDGSQLKCASVQFKGKDIRDPFKVGADVAAVSRASISINSSSRAIRNSARRIARALLTPPGTAK